MVHISSNSQQRSAMNQEQQDENDTICVWRKNNSEQFSFIGGVLESSRKIGTQSLKVTSGLVVVLH